VPTRLYVERKGRVASDNRKQSVINQKTENIASQIEREHRVRKQKTKHQKIEKGAFSLLHVYDVVNHARQDVRDSRGLCALTIAVGPVVEVI
jgi:hypothetical protein